MTGLGSPCGACKFLRRKCVNGCVFAPYFCHEQGAAHFSVIHKVFGASNVSKLLMQIPINDRWEAVVTICYEAQARLQDPVYGCVSHIFALQQQVVTLQAQLSSLKSQATTMRDSGTLSSENFPCYQDDGLDFVQPHNLVPNSSIGSGTMFYNENYNAFSNANDEQISFRPDNSSSCEIKSIFNW